MKITFIRPNLCAGRSTDAMQPLVFAILRALTPPDVETVLHDERLAPVPLDEPTDLVAMTVETYTARRAYQLAAEYRKRGVPVVMGGFHPTFVPDECALFADAVVLGDAEGAWPRVVEDARRGRLQPRYHHQGHPPLGGTYPDRSIFAGKSYVPWTLVQHGRGCRFNCDFCSIHAFYGSTLRRRSVAETCDEIERAGRQFVFFVDDNLFADMDGARELFHALIPLRIKWTCQTSIDVARDPALVELMARSGCSTALFGFESLDRRNLQQMRKGWNVKWQDYDTAIRIVHDAGIMIYGTFVLGYDHDTTRSFDDTLQFAIEHRFALANFNPLTPTPRAPLHDRLAREGRLLFDRWWLDPEFRYGQATFRPRGMTPDELTDGCWRARREFNQLGATVRRFFSRPTLSSPGQAARFAFANYVSRREILRKQDIRLGGTEPLELPASLPPVEGPPGASGAGANVEAMA